MTSFSQSIKNTNCNLALKNSLFFSIYHNKIKNDQFYKTNNQIKSYYKDSILDDFIYLSTNGLKKNAIFRRNEINLNSKTLNFVSYFNKVEDNLLVFTLYPQKYLTDLIINYNKNKEIILNNLNKNVSTKKINSLFHNNLVTNNAGKNFFLKNYFDKYFFVNDTGNILTLDNKLFQKQLFSGLLYVLPKQLQENFKSLFSINYLLLSYYSNINILKLNNNSNFLANLYIYTFYLKYLNFKILSFLKHKNIKIRKSNWLLYKFIKLYFQPLTNISNLLYSIAHKTWFNKIYKFKNFDILNVYKEVDFNYLNNKNNLIYINKLSQFQKIKYLRNILYLLQLQYQPSINTSEFKNRLLTKYFLLKIITQRKYISNIYINSYNYIWNNYYKLFLVNILTNNLYNDRTKTLSSNILIQSKNLNIKEDSYYLNREFLKLVKSKTLIKFTKNINVKRKVDYLTLIKFNQTKQLKKEINAFKRTFVRKTKNKKIFRKINKTFTLAYKQYKIAKLEKIRQLWLKIYNKVNVR